MESILAAVYQGSLKIEMLRCEFLPDYHVILASFVAPSFVKPSNLQIVRTEAAKF